MKAVSQKTYIVFNCMLIADLHKKPLKRKCVADAGIAHYFSVSEKMNVINIDLFAYGYSPATHIVVIFEF